MILFVPVLYIPLAKHRNKLGKPMMRIGPGAQDQKVRRRMIFRSPFDALQMDPKTITIRPREVTPMETPCVSGEMRYLSTYQDAETAIPRYFSSGLDHWTSKGMEEGKDYACSSKSPRRLWIDVIHYMEGIGGWHISLSELLQFSKEISATLVEPCMKDGKIHTCGENGFTIPVSKVLDLSFALKPFRNRPPLMVSYKDYQSILKQFHGRRTVHAFCIEPFKNNTNCVPTSSLIEDMLDEKLFTSLEIHKYWKRDSMASLRDWLKLGHLNDTSHLRKIQIHPQHVNTVQKVLKSSNVPLDSFSVVHWRAERVGMDFMECAKAVLKTRRRMENRNNNPNRHPYILMTSLNVDPDMMWWGANRFSNNTTKQALDFLVKEKGFIKFDSLLKASKIEIEDSGMLAVYDLVLASMSRNFATCARNLGGTLGNFCSKEAHQICDECNHIGNFGLLAINLRDKKRGSSFSCWPQGGDLSVEEQMAMNSQNKQI